MIGASGSIGVALGVLFGVLLVAGSLTWGERRLLGLWQDRYGPNRAGPLGLLQALADVVKVATKEDWVPPFADRTVFVLAPAVLVVAVLLPFAVIELAPGIVIADLNIGLLFFLATSSLGVYGVALGGWASNSKFALLASVRAVGQMVSYEVFMALSLLGVVVLAGSFSLGEIVRAQQRIWFCIPQLPGLLLFLVAGLGEMRRGPLDLVEADSELVAGFHTEYSGMKFAAFFVGEYIGLLLVASLTVVLYFGGWLGPVLPPLAWFLLKLLAVLVLLILPRATLPRPRYDQLMGLGWKILLPLALLNLVVTGGIVLAAGS